MSSDLELRRIAFVGDYVPRQCGIATFTQHLRNAVAGQIPATECIVVPVNDIVGGYEYPPEARFEFGEQDLNSYRRAADFLNFSSVDVVSLQHEYGIFGGPAGSHILALARDLRVPIVTTLHTVLQEPSAEQRKVFMQLAELSARLVVMTQRGQRMLEEIYDVPPEKIDLIAHGIPDLPFVDPTFHKDQFGVEGKFVALTFGLLSPNKGIEYVLRALPRVISEFPDFIYIVLGATHPNLVREDGEEYRHSLVRLAQDLGIEDHVIFYNRFVEHHELTEFIGAADLYITPYLNPAQVTSGTLAYAFGCGKAVISTPYWHAEELLADDRGVLVPFADSEAVTQEILSLIRDETRRHAMRKRAYLMGREMVWGNVANSYIDAFQHARRGRGDTPARRLQVRTLGQQPRALPQLRLDHLLRMTDSTGLLQHARHTVPVFNEGYCTDDNSRALLLTVWLEALGQNTADVLRVQSMYAAFLEYAVNRGTHRFRNFLGYGRNWLEEDGSDDCLGARGLGALGACVGRSERRRLQRWAVPLFEPAAAAAVESAAPRAWATALIGVNEYLQRFSGDRRVSQIRDALVGKLLDSYARNATDTWQWFEDAATYENARLPQALLMSARCSGNAAALAVGLDSLRWLVDVQTSVRGFFHPIGSNGFWHKGQPRAEFDQQPLEAWAMVSACIEAFHATTDSTWLSTALRAFEWFMGRNVLGQAVYDSATGGCCDGLHEDRINQNQGAESTLSFLSALAEMQLLGDALAAVSKLADRPTASDSRPLASAGAVSPDG